MFFEQYSHEPYVATPRFIVRHLAADASAPSGAAKAARERTRRARGHGNAPARRTSFSSASATRIADIALYAYTHVAEDGGLELAPFPRVKEWLRAGREPTGARGFV